MSDLVDLLKTRWPEPPPPTADATRRLAERVVAGGRSRTSRRTGRVAVVGALTAVAAVAMAVLLVVVRPGSERTTQPAVPVVPPARVDWGMDATIELRPDPGVTMAEMRGRFEAALARRTLDRDGAGVEVISSEGERVVVRLPGAEAPTQVRSHLSFSRLMILDADRSVVASGPDLVSFRDAASRHRAPGGAMAYWVQPLDRNWAPGTISRFRTRADAERWRRKVGATRATVLALPADMWVVEDRGGRRSRLSLLREAVAVPSASIRDVSWSARRVGVHVDPASVPAAGRRVIVLQTLGTPASEQQYVMRVGSGAIDSAGWLSLPSDARLSLSTTSSPDLGGTITVRAMGRYGQQPALAGTPFTPPEAALARVRIPRRFAPNRWTKVLSTTVDGRGVRLIAGQRGASVVSIGTDQDGYGYGTLSSGPPTQCGAGVGTPRVVHCGGSLGSDWGPRWTSAILRYIGYGRVQPDVARIVVTLPTGEHADAHIENGWYYVTVEKRMPVPARRDGRRPMPPMPRPTTRAFDAAGAEIPIPDLVMVG